MDLSWVKQVVAPLVLKAFDEVVMPELVKLEGQIASEDLKLVVDTVLQAVKKIGDTEIPKI